jgi:hypothetical protein
MVIPEKEYNEMTGKMESTSLPQWQEYYQALANFQEMMEDRKPKRELFADVTEFERALSQWQMKRSCDEPNKPGYYRANND